MVTALIAFVPIGMLFGYLWHGARERDRSDTLRSLTQVAEAVAVIANDAFDEGIIAASAIAADSAIASLDPDLVVPRLGELRAFFPQYANILVVGADGTVVGWSAFDPPLTPPRNIADRPFFGRVISIGRPTVVRVGDAQDAAGMNIGVAAPILSTNGAPIGLVALMFDVERINSRMSRVQLYPGQVLTLIDPNGRVAALTGPGRPPAGQLAWELRDRSNIPEVQAALHGQVVATDAFRGPIVGDQRFAAFVPTPRYGWVVGASWTVAEALAPTREAEQRELIAFTLIAVVIVLGALFASRFLTAPLQKLTEHVRRFGDGQFDPVDDIGADDEIGELALTFNTMGERLRQTLDDLRGERARLEAIVQCLPIGVVIRAAPSGQFVMSNPQAEQIWRLSEGSMADSGWYASRPGRRADGRPYERAEWPLARALRDGEIVHAEEMHIKRGDGTDGVILASSAPIRDEQGNIVAAVSAFSDITEQRAVEARLREREVVLSALIEQFPGAVSVLDRDLRYVLASRYRVVDAGLTSDQLVGRCLTSLYSPPYVDDAVGAAARAFAGETVSTNVATDGKVFRLITTPLRAASGEVQHVLGVGLDVTEERDRAERASRNEKLRALGHLAGGIAHDINQALALVAGYGELAMTALDQNAPGLRDVRDMIGIMSLAAYNGGESVKRLLTFARGHTNEPHQPVDVGSLLHDVEQLTAPRWRATERAEGRSVELHVDAEPGLTIDGSPAELREAITNLIFNALDAMPRGGTIVLSARRDGGRVRIDIADSGVGMTSDVRQRIFEPFFTTKGERGMGLGLAMVFGIVQRHGGQIDVTTTVGQGTIVHLSFPSGQAGAAGSSGDAGEQSTRQLRILVVDDEPKLAALAAGMTRRDGHQATTVYSGEEALEHLAAAPFDLVLTDLSMGDGMNGWDLAAAIGHISPGLPVVLTTGWGAAIDEEEARARGVQAVVAKPYHIAEIREVVTRLTAWGASGVTASAS
jgi:PAS domain S-box-containing protein